MFSVADMKNACGEARQGPPSASAGLFIFSHIEFSKDVNWIHIDCASPSFVKERATSYGTPLICALLAKHTDVDIAK
jgi:leucyl aminopeptidase